MGRFSRNAAADHIHNEASALHPRLNGELAEWGRVGLFFSPGVSSLDPVIVSAGTSNSHLSLQGSKCFLAPPFPGEAWRPGPVLLGWEGLALLPKKVSG